MTVDEVHATAVLTSQQVVYNPSQKWYYLSKQEETEILVFKSMDSIVRGEGLCYLRSCICIEYLTRIVQLLMDPFSIQLVPKANPRERALN